MTSINLNRLTIHSKVVEKSIPPPLPTLLSHPNIPKPMHGVNPRTIMGKDKWDSLRKEVYRKHNFHCAGCGVHKSNAKKHQWLEAHENYVIDYRTQIMTILDIQPLCHYCHSFIHSGLLAIKLLNKEKGVEEVRETLQHGASVLRGNGLIMNRGTAELCKQVGVIWNGPVSTPIRISWGGWSMIYQGKSYKQKFPTLQSWKQHKWN